MLISPLLGTIGRDVAERASRLWWLILLNGLLLIAAGVIVFSIDWTVRQLATFIGALFIFQGLMEIATPSVDGDRTWRMVAGVLGIATGIAIIVWSGPGVLVTGIFLGSWLIVTGTLEIAAAIAARDFFPGWWLVLVLGLLQVPLGVLALADPSGTLAALITVLGIWSVVIGTWRVVLAFEVKRLPKLFDDLDSPRRPGRPRDGAERLAPV